jgi:hypothetical protein
MKGLFEMKGFLHLTSNRKKIERFQNTQNNKLNQEKFSFHEYAKISQWEISAQIVESP